MKKLVSLSISISDTSISTALIEHSVSKKNAPVVKPIIKTFRSKAINPEHKEITSAYLEQRLATMLKSIICDTKQIDVQKAGYTLKDIRRVAVSLSAPWFEGKTIISHFEEQKEFKVSNLIMKKALDSEIKAISGVDKDAVTILESAILSSTLNGYTVQEPLGKMAKSLTLFGYVSYAKTSTKNIILDSIDTFFHHVSDIIIRSEPTILLRAASHEAKRVGFENDYAIIRVNEILTHIQIIKNEHIRELGTVPIGLNMILNDISAASNVTPEVSYNILKLYVNGELDPAFKKNIENIVHTALDKWTAAIKEFSSISLSTGRFPSQVFLSSPTIISQIFKDYLIKDNYLDLTMSVSSLNIQLLDRGSLNSLVDIDKEVKNEPGLLTKLNAML